MRAIVGGKLHARQVAGSRHIGLTDGCRTSAMGSCRASGSRAEPRVSRAAMRCDPRFGSRDAGSSRRSRSDRHAQSARPHDLAIGDCARDRPDAAPARPVVAYILSREYPSSIASRRRMIAAGATSQRGCATTQLIRIGAISAFIFNDAAAVESLPASGNGAHASRRLRFPLRLLLCQRHRRSGRWHRGNDGHDGHFDCSRISCRPAARFARGPRGMAPSCATSARRR